MSNAILLLGFNRVDYFGQTLAALQANDAAHDCDLHVYLDGGAKAKQDEIVALVKASTFENVNYVLRDKNWGIGRHLIDARRTLFDELNYERVILLEDDMILAPSYIQTVLDLSKWSQQYCDVGTVMAYNINADSLEQQQSQHQHVIATNRHFWGYVLTRDVWQIIKPIVYDFESKYLMKTSYAKRSHFRIRWMFMRSWMSKKRQARSGKRMVPEECLSAPFPKIPRKSPTSQDAITALALWHHGFTRITTRVSRAQYIGVEGFSFSPEVYAQMGFEDQNTPDLATLTQVPETFQFTAKDQQGNTIKPRPYE
ncbi:MAG: glycosyltransferase family 2 protein [Euryarchaeota archaeon]|nr:glycosyltransferase family 2 protein [Euryarchaeota archaeon]